ncbi:hypothetical protein ILUMI_25135 [Ignelater luminosus]|uniref:Uncharacterized protein n=1 Tax=Ignelater luminosus TaxID=2038154 RepID=A0A8K0FY50_IGNLU|nr:hypothetical protein ILUMI_25135 [Ignelater luminosus]
MATRTKLILQLAKEKNEKDEISSINICKTDTSIKKNKMIMMIKAIFFSEHESSDEYSRTKDEMSETDYSSESDSDIVLPPEEATAAHHSFPPLLIEYPSASLAIRYNTILEGCRTMLNTESDCMKVLETEGSSSCSPPSSALNEEPVRFQFNLKDERVSQLQLNTVT